MEKKGVFTKILTIVGMALVWFPLLAPVLFAALSYIQDRRLRLDYLMPAELFPAVLVGAGLLVWAALRAHSHRKIILWGLAGAAGTLALSQAMAVVTGLASGQTEPAGWPLALVMALLIAYILAVGVIGVGGFLLLGDVYKTKKQPPP